MSIYNKLLKNSGIFAIANLGSKLISLILVPFYTYVLSSEQYGTIDIISTTSSLILPIITLSIFEATLRFSVKSEHSEEKIFSTSLIVAVIGNLVFLIFYPVLDSILIFKQYTILIYILIFMQSINAIFSQFARGLEEIKVFAMSGVITTIITLVMNILLLAKFNMGIEGYLISIIIANVVCNIFLFSALKLYKYFKLSYYSNKLSKEMLVYSLPLIPNALMWWIMNASDRYIITLFFGVATNGIYAVAYKVPSILYIINNIFFQAWQLSAIEESNSKEKSKFYTNVFNIFSVVMIMATSGILIFIKQIIELIIAKEFVESWTYVPFLLLAVVFSSFSSFLGTNYIAMKETKGVLKTSIISAVINLVLNITLSPIFGANGTAFATMISFFVLWIIRAYDTRSFVQIKVDVKRLILMLSIISVQIIMLWVNLKYNIIIELGLFLMLLFINRNIFMEIYNMFKSKIIKRTA